MGILDQVLGGVLGGGSSPIQGVLMNLLGGGPSPGAMAGTAPQPGGPAMGGGMMAGGLPGLVGMFEQAGLGHIVQSWIGNGQNQPVSPDQLQRVLGEGRVNDMAGQAGMERGDFLSQLSQHLPEVVNGMTPEGKLPEDGKVWA